jgi:hypothetical protein
MGWDSMTRYTSGHFIDHVYSNNQIVRIDKSASQSADLLEGRTFDSPVLWTGSTAPYKLYNNQTLSVYLLGESPITPLEGSTTVYGIKIDLVTQERLYKTEDSSYIGTYDAKTLTHNNLGELVGVDYYFATSIQEARQYAESNNITFPVPLEVEPDVWLWGVYYGLESIPQVMKAYVAVE